MLKEKFNMLAGAEVFELPKQSPTFKFSEQGRRNGQLGETITPVPCQPHYMLPHANHANTCYPHATSTLVTPLTRVDSEEQWGTAFKDWCRRRDMVARGKKVHFLVCGVA